MSKLLSAGFARLQKNNVFRIGMIFMLFMGIYLSFMRYAIMKETGYVETLDSGFFSYASLIEIVSSIFCGLFVGTEYSDGTIRNKIIIGHARWAIYLSNFIICAAAGILLCMAFIVPYLCVGIPTLGFFETDIKLILILISGTFFMTLGLLAVYTLISMLNQNKAVSAVTCILCAFLFLFAGAYINSRLSEPEMYSSYSYMIDGELIENEEMPNPNYLSGTKRKVYAFLYDFLPGGQAIQYINQEVKNPQLLILYSGVIMIAATGAGSFFFRKKDLK